MKRIISTPNAPAAIGPYSQAVEANGTLYISGQLPINPAVGKIEATNVIDHVDTLQVELVESKKLLLKVNKEYSKYP